MPEPSTVAVFAAAAIAILLFPGPAVTYIVTRSIGQGRRAGIVSTLGVGTGGLFHVAAAALGLSALLMSSAIAFDAVRYAGAAYLVYLGIRKLLSRNDAALADGTPRESLRRVFSQGIVVNVLNPKAALFFFAFLPQFVDVSAGHVTLQIVLLGTLFLAMGICSDSVYALLGAALGKWLRGNVRFERGERFFTGGVFITLGVAAALSGGKARGK